MTTDVSKIQKTKRPYPEWAEAQIANLKQVEVFLGNLPKAPEWESRHLDALAKESVAREYSAINERTSELVFATVVKKLHAEGHDSESIAQMINERLCYKNGPPYCNSEEVSEALIAP